MSCTRNKHLLAQGYYIPFVCLLLPCFCSNKLSVTLAGQKDKSGLLETSPTRSTGSGSYLTDAFNGSTSSIETPSGVLCSLEEEEEEEIVNSDVAKGAYTFGSRLSKTLPEVLTDKSALGYFIQFMDTRKRVALIKFWLEVECLCSASGMYDATENARHSNQKELLDALPTSLDDNENLSCNVLANNVDIQTSSETRFDEHADNSDNATFVASNGMPKTSQAISEARQSSHDRGGKRHDMTTTKQDASRIYKRYILKEALGVNQIIPEQVRLNMEKAVAQENIEPILRCLSAVQSIVYDTLENE